MCISLLLKLSYIRSKYEGLNLPIINPKFVLTSVLTKFVEGNIVDKTSVNVVIKACLFFGFTNSTLKISEMESSSGPILKIIKQTIVNIDNIIN